MIGLEPLRPATVHLLGTINRTLDPPTWIEEVEDFVLGTGAADTLRAGSGQVLLVRIDGEPGGVALHRPHQDFVGAELLSAFLLAPEHRGRHLAEPVFSAVIAAAHASSGKDHVIWLVHERNTPMVTVSTRVCGENGLSDDHGYLVFIHDR